MRVSVDVYSTDREISALHFSDDSSLSIRTYNHANVGDIFHILISEFSGSRDRVGLSVGGNRGRGIRGGNSQGVGTRSTVSIGSNDRYFTCINETQPIISNLCNGSIAGTIGYCAGSIGRCKWCYAKIRQNTCLITTESQGICGRVGNGDTANGALTSGRSSQRNRGSATGPGRVRPSTFIGIEGNRFRAVRDIAYHNLCDCSACDGYRDAGAQNHFNISTLV